jgi:hypothetical protein
MAAIDIDHDLQCRPAETDAESDQQQRKSEELISTASRRPAANLSMKEGIC